MRIIPNHPLTYALLGGQTAILIASVFPIWTLWWFGPRAGLSERTTLWSVLWYTVIEVPKIQSSGDMCDILIGGFFFTMGAILGWLTYSHMKRMRRA